jgi:ankyrin repeat protein
MVVILGAIGSALIIFSTGALLRGLGAFVLFGAVIRLVALLYCIWTGSPTGCSRLTGAIILRKPDRVRELVNGGYDVNVRERDGRTPLFAAIETRQTEITELLLQHGADADVRAHDLSTPLHIASAVCDVSTTELLLVKDADVNARTLSGETPLHRVGSASKDDEVQNRYSRLARILIDAGVDVTAADANGATALHYAAVVGSTEVLQLLLEHGADINAKTWNGATPLGMALLPEDDSALESLKFLIARGADVNAEVSDASTPLFLAVLNTRTSEPAKALIAAGAVVSAASANGLTPLHEAARAGTSEMVGLLLSHGASADERDHQSRRPIDLAGDKQKRDILKKAMVK